MSHSPVQALLGGKTGSSRHWCLEQLQQHCPDVPQSLPDESVQSSPWHHGRLGRQGGLRGGFVVV